MNVIPRGARTAFALIVAAAAMAAALLAPGGKAFGAYVAADNQLSVSVPTSCEMVVMADGTLVTPSNIEIENETKNSIVMSSCKANYLCSGVELDYPETLSFEGTEKKALPISGKLTDGFTGEIAGSLNGSVKAAELSMEFYNATNLSGTLTATGTPTIGNTLSVFECSFEGENKSTFEDDLVALTFAWYRDGVEIPGTEKQLRLSTLYDRNATYTLTDDDLGHTITCRAFDTYSKVYYGGYLESNAIGPVTAPIAGSVSLDKAEAEPGEAITASVVGCNVPENARTYEWEVSGEETATQHGEFDGSKKEMNYAVDVTTSPAKLRIESVGAITSSKSENGIETQAASGVTTYVAVMSPSGGWLAAEGDPTDSNSSALADTGYYEDKEYILDETGTYTVRVYTGEYGYEPCQYDISLTQDVSSTVAGASSYVPSSSEVGKTISCKVSDSRGYVTGSLQSGACSIVKSKTAFAVYSADDQSLRFYKRADVPSKGDLFEGRPATDVYELDLSYGYNPFVLPDWNEHASDIKSVRIEDRMAPTVSTGLMCWFYDMTALESADLSNLATEKPIGATFAFMGCTSLKSVTLPAEGFKIKGAGYMFSGCTSLESIDLTGVDTSAATNTNFMFNGCSSLTALDLSGFDMGSVSNMAAMFDGCSKLSTVTLGEKWRWVGTGCYLPAQSDATIPEADGKWHAESDATAYAPEDVPSGKADTYHAGKEAFAVFSADDGSLDFYKRYTVPTAGSTFEGKAATAVYTGIESLESSYYQAIPWAEVSGSITEINVVDDGIKPKRMDTWFADMTSLVDVDVNKLDISSAVLYENGGMFDLFRNDSSLKKLDISGWDFTDADADDDEVLCGMYDGCTSLEEITVGSSHVWGLYYGYLPTPSSANIPGADGKWHAASDWKSYNPRDIPNRKADTYYAYTPTAQANSGTAAPNIEIPDVEVTQNSVNAGTGTTSAKAGHATANDSVELAPTESNLPESATDERGSTQAGHHANNTTTADDGATAETSACETNSETIDSESAELNGEEKACDANGGCGDAGKAENPSAGSEDDSTLSS